MAWPKPMPLVEVDWLDSVTTGGWGRPRAFRKKGALRCRTAGYLFSEDEARLVVVQSQAENGDLADSMTIPRAAVLGVAVLREAFGD